MFARSFAFRAFAQPCSRGLLFPGLQPSPTLWRTFTANAPRAKAAIKPKQQPIAYKPQPKVQAQSAEETLKFAGRRPEGFGKLERKVAKEGTLLLFSAPSLRSYVLGAYGIASFCFAYAVYNSNAVFRDPLVPLPMWQQGLFGGICVMMSVMGTVFLVKTSRLIRSVHAVAVNGQTYLRFNVRSAVPFKKSYSFDVLPRQIAFSRRLIVSPSAQTARHAELAAGAQKSQVSFFKAPLQKTSMIIWRLFRAVRQIFTQEDFILLEVEGQKGVFRMDSAGYVAEDFLIIGNPVSIRR